MDAQARREAGCRERPAATKQSRNSSAVANPQAANRNTSTSTLFWTAPSAMAITFSVSSSVR